MITPGEHAMTTTTETHWKNLFETWRGKKSEKENNYLKTALLVKKNLQGMTLDDITKKLGDQHSPEFQQLDEFGKRSLGTVLFCIFTIDDHLKSKQKPSLSNEHKQYLLTIETTLKQIFDSPTKQLTSNIDGLLATAEQIMAIDMTTIQNKKAAIEIGYTLFATLTLIKTYAETYNSFALRTFGVTSYLNSVDENLFRIKSYIVKLEQALVDEANMEKTSEVNVNVSSKTLQEHLNDRFLNIIKDTTLDLTSKSNQIKNELGSVNNTLKDLHNKKSQSESLQAEMGAYEEVILSLQSHPTELSGLSQFIDMIKNPKIKEALGAASYDPLNQKLTEIESDYKKAEEQSYLSQAGEYLLSKTYSLLSFVLPTEAALYEEPTQNEQSQVSYDQCRTQLIQLLNDHHSNLRLKLSQVMNDTDQLESKICNNQSDVKNLLSVKTADEINQLLLANQQTESTFNTFDQYLSEIKSHSDQLHQIEHYSQAIKSLINKNDTLLVKISNYFAQKFPSIFQQSETAKMVDQAKSIEKELNQSQINYQTKLAQSISNITKDYQSNTLLFKDHYVSLITNDSKNNQQPQSKNEVDLEEINQFINSMK